MPKGVYERTPEMIAARMGRKTPDKTRKKISDAMMGVPKSPEHCAAISAGHRNSDAVKAKNEAQKGVPISKGVPKSPEHIAAALKGREEAGVYEAMRGGFDIVNHHYIYDHSDLSKNIVQMTRSDHASLHNVLRKLGYIVAHVNAPDEPKGELLDTHIKGSDNYD